MKRKYPFSEAKITLSNRIARVVWKFCSLLFYRPTPIFMHGWRRFILRIFGAKVGKGAFPYPKAKIWAPWNLTMGDYSCLANDVDCYCVAPIILGKHVTISQYSYLCSASHDYRNPTMPLIIASIAIDDLAWVAADVFVGPGVHIGEGAVIGAKSAVVSNIDSWKFAAGNPAIVKGDRPVIQT